MNRRRLPNRRHTETVSFAHDGIGYVASWSRFEDGRLGEVFLRGGKCNSAVDVLASDGAMAVSLALQFGCPPDALRDTLSGRGESTSGGPLGALLQMLATQEDVVR